MKLAAWLKQNDLTQQEFLTLSKESGGKFSIHALNKWCSGNRIPRPKDMYLIASVTRGGVQPNDFYMLDKANVR
jgi:transcriptional regulator with XRE-family HTH domain